MECYVGLISIKTPLNPIIFEQTSNSSFNNLLKTPGLCPIEIINFCNISNWDPNEPNNPVQANQHNLHDEICTTLTLLITKKNSIRSKIQIWIDKTKITITIIKISSLICYGCDHHSSAMLKLNLLSLLCANFRIPCDDFIGNYYNFLGY